MKRFSVLLLLIFSFAIVPSVYANAGDYVLGPNDAIAMNVWGYEEFEKNEKNELIIRPDGKISIPLAGEIKAEGLTISELNKVITSSLSEYIRDPKVTLNVTKFRTTRVYVFGEVKKPGLYELEKDHNLLDAIGKAEGYTADAAKKKVIIIHKDQRDRAYTEANLLDILTKGDMRQNYTLQEGDVVYLSSNGRLNFARDILPYLTAIKYVDDIENDD